MRILTHNNGLIIDAATLLPFGSISAERDELERLFGPPRPGPEPSWDVRLEDQDIIARIQYQSQDLHSGRIVWGILGSSNFSLIALQHLLTALNEAAALSQARRSSSPCPLADASEDALSRVCATLKALLDEKGVCAVFTAQLILPDDPDKKTISPQEPNFALLAVSDPALIPRIAALAEELDEKRREPQPGSPPGARRQ